MACLRPPGFGPWPWQRQRQACRCRARCCPGPGWSCRCWWRSRALPRYRERGAGQGPPADVRPETLQDGRHIVAVGVCWVAHRVDHNEPLGLQRSSHTRAADGQHRQPTGTCERAIAAPACADDNTSVSWSIPRLVSCAATSCGVRDALLVTKHRREPDAVTVSRDWAALGQHPTPRRRRRRGPPGRNRSPVPMSRWVSRPNVARRPTRTDDRYQNWPQGGQALVRDVGRAADAADTLGVRRSRFPTPR